MSINRLLVVDDEPGIAAIVAKVAASAEYEVLTTGSAEEFRRRLVDWKPTHLLLDLHMPGTDGIELMRTLAEERCQAKVMLMSGFDPRVLEAAGRLGQERGLKMVGTIAKPVRVAELMQILTALRNTEDVIDGPALERALDQGQITLDYQPKIKLNGNLVTECEALARWRHPTRGVVPPLEFVTLAEQSGLANQLTEEVAKLALAQVADWRRRGLAIDVAINLSGRNLAGVAFADLLIDLCERFDVKPEWVTLELTETAAAANAVDAMDILTRLRLRGFRLSIDDFGTGYSSLKQLQRLPFSELKIDREFVLGCATRREDTVIVKTMVDLAHNLGLSAVAEGAEDKAVIDQLSQLGCDYVQGYFYSRPLNAEAAEAWITKWSAGQAAVK